MAKKGLQSHSLSGSIVGGFSLKVYDGTVISPGRLSFTPQLNHNLCMYTQGIILHQMVSSADQSVQDPDAPVGLPQSEIERGHIQKLAG